MNPAQERAIQQVDEGISLLARRLMVEYDLSEDEALALLYQEDKLVDMIQEEKLEEIFSNTKVRVVDSPKNPKEYYPGHHAFIPPLTTTDTFNAHMAQALSPYVLAIAKKIAKDRDVEAPNEQEIIKVLNQTDWAKAAYEAKKMPSKPSFPRLRAFLSKYIGKPIQKTFDKIPIDAVLAMAASGTIMWLIWTTFKNHVEQVGSPPGDLLLAYGDYKQRKILKKLNKGL
jgi:hypothetical protein